jgi:type IV secretion system protein VirB9
MKKMMILMILALMASGQAQAVNKPVDHTNDKRVKTISYRANDIIPVNASLKHVTHIDLGEGNLITDIEAGDTESWLFSTTAAGDGVFIKPVVEDAKTNLTIITDKRKYYFDIRRSEWSSTYRVRFTYPEDEFAKVQSKLDAQKKKTVQNSLEIDRVAPEDWNFSYLLEGDKTTAPVNMFDDGVFTYLEFGKRDIPAIFSVDSMKNESVVNFHRSGRYVVLEGVFKQLTMRSGVDSTCVFNKSFDDQIQTESEIERVEVQLNEGVQGE